MNSYLEQLEMWYQAQCNGEWEHSFGIEITTLDNPGWMVSIELSGTPLERAEFVTINPMSEGRNWLSCEVKDKKFLGAGGAGCLNDIIEVFIKWSAKH